MKEMKLLAIITLFLCTLLSYIPTFAGTGDMILPVLMGRSYEIQLKDSYLPEKASASGTLLGPPTVAHPASITGTYPGGAPYKELDLYRKEKAIFTVTISMGPLVTLYIVDPEIFI